MLMSSLTKMQRTTCANLLKCGLIDGIRNLSQKTRNRSQGNSIAHQRSGHQGEMDTRAEKTSGLQRPLRVSWRTALQAWPQQTASMLNIWIAHGTIKPPKPWSHRPKFQPKLSRKNICILCSSNCFRSGIRPDQIRTITRRTPWRIE